MVCFHFLSFSSPINLSIEKFNIYVPGFLLLTNFDAINTTNSPLVKVYYVKIIRKRFTIDKLLFLLITGPDDAVAVVGPHVGALFGRSSDGKEGLRKGKEGLGRIRVWYGWSLTGWSWERGIKSVWFLMVLWVCWDSGFDELRRWRNRRKKRIKGKRNVCGGPL